MAVIDLTKPLGLGLMFDSFDIVPTDGSIDILSKSVVHLTDMIPQLIQKDLVCPVIAYTIFHRIDRKKLLDKRGVSLDCIVLPPGLFGVEYAKTRGYKSDRTIVAEVLFGECRAIVQDDMRVGVINLPTRSIYPIYAGSQVVFQNVTEKDCLLALYYLDSIRSCFDDTNGAAIYHIKKGSELETPRNPQFKNMQRANLLDITETMNTLKLNTCTPFLKQLMRKKINLDWFFKNEVLLDDLISKIDTSKTD